MHRIVNSSIGHHNITQGCIVMLDELIHQMQFPKTLIKQAIQHMIATVPEHQSAWGLSKYILPKGRAGRVKKKN